ncbi:hypothetical protein F2P56_022617 [Juglans regia]|uniref:Protein FAR1-RELATED SEQUENCE n=2 Tax=Juglans regia TaxID=51240 RepID=A0A2I4F2R9_JUGRE|nr:protein FAR1-RELATED SEQUENCE 5-like [Juglans regia]KAF5458596.1 hypothetical protein F2P56_022617 [Juglans regia]
MNAFFDGYDHAKTNLKEFFNQFDNALKNKIENETVADFHSFRVSIPCISRSPIKKRFQELYMNAKFREVQQQTTGIIDMDPKLFRHNGTIKTYHVEDEIHVEEFTKLVTHYVDFSEEDTAAKCSGGLWILCRHILAVFKCNGIKSVPNTYILDRWRKDMKRRYTLIHSNYETRDHRAYSNRYSSLLNTCYQMITNVACSSHHTEDATTKLYAMIDLYRANQEPPSITLTGVNVGCTTACPTTIGSSKHVLNPNAMRGKDRPSSMRRALRMEKDTQKVKTKMKRAPVKGKCKHRDGGDTTVVDTCRWLFGPSEMDTPNVEQV